MAFFGLCKINGVSFFSRSARCNDLRPFNPRHSDLRPADDVFNHPPHRLLHRVALWRRHHADAVFHEHTVRTDNSFYLLYGMFSCSVLWCYLFPSRVGVDSDQDTSVSNYSMINMFVFFFSQIGWIKNNILVIKQQLTNKCCAQQSSAVLEGSLRRNNKHESAWPFRIWYTFDHKYP